MRTTERPSAKLVVAAILYLLAVLATINWAINRDRACIDGGGRLIDTPYNTYTCSIP